MKGTSNGGEGRKGTMSCGRFRLSVWCQGLPREVFWCNLGHFLSQPGPCFFFFFFSDELVPFKIWADQRFTQLLVHKERRVGGVEVPVSDSPAPKLEVSKFSPNEIFTAGIVPTSTPPPPTHQTLETSCA